MSETKEIEAYMPAIDFKCPHCGEGQYASCNEFNKGDDPDTLAYAEVSCDECYGLIEINVRL